MRTKYIYKKTLRKVYLMQSKDVCDDLICTLSLNDIKGEHNHKNWDKGKKLNMQFLPASALSFSIKRCK